MIRSLLLAAALAPAVFCQDWNRVTEDFKFSYKLTPTGRVSVEGYNGSIDVTGWERNEIEIVGTKYASSDELLKEIKIDTMNTADTVTLRVHRLKNSESWFGRGGTGVKMTIRVPRKAQLDRIASSNGSVRIESVDGDARVTTSNGAIRVANLGGKLDASTSNGKLEAIDIKGGAMLRTSNGSIQAESVRGPFEASTSNGAIRARIDDVPSGSPVRATSSNGSIELTFSSFHEHEVKASTSNSAITVRLPERVNAELRAATSNSNVTSDYDVTVRGAISKNRLEGRLGSGGSLINLTSSNGPIRIQKLL